MGGAFAHSGNVTAWAEANIHNDPEAAAVVFAQDWDTTLVPLDVTMTQTLDAADLVRLEAIPGALPQALARMLPAYLDFYAGVFPGRRCALHDPLAAMVAAGALRGVSVSSGTVDVRLERGERGRTVSSSGSRTQRWVRGMEGSAVEVLLDRLESREWPA